MSDETKSTVGLAMGLVGTLAALVLGLLISSAKSFYDTQTVELTEMSAKLILLDRILSHYGPEAHEARAALRNAVVSTIDRVWQKSSQGPPSGSNLVGGEYLYEQFQQLSPKDDAQRSLQSQAVNLGIALGQTRWLMVEQATTSVSRPLVIVMTFWLTIIFISWGLFAPSNPITLATMLVCAVSVSGAILLILQLYAPYEGWIHISSAPLRAALMHLGQ